MADFDPGSFRDRDSRVFRSGDQILRALSPDGAEDWLALKDSGLAEKLIGEGRLVATDEDSNGAAAAELAAAFPGKIERVLRHEPVPFVSYPYEWPFAMLREAGLLQLDLILESVEKDLILKDASPYNVQWRGTKPVFIDVGSFERLEPGSPWIGYRQFCMLWLFPLMLRAYRDLPHATVLRGAIDGVSPTDARKVLRGRDNFRRGVFKHVLLHAALERRYSDSGGEGKRDLKKASLKVELLKANVASVRRVVSRLSWDPGTTAWTDYGEVNEYGEQDARRKADFVSAAAATRHWGLTWDLGCNNGAYTRLAAKHSDYTLALDSDEAVIDRLYREFRDEGEESILPLVLNLADGSPGLGWRGRERLPLETRGRPDFVIALAVIHHLSITANIPVAEIINWLRSLDCSLVIEFVTREDPMVKLLLSRKQQGANSDYERGNFERLLGESFEIERTEEVCEGRRALYFATPA